MKTLLFMLACAQALIAAELRRILPDGVSTESLAPVYSPDSSLFFFANGEDLYLQETNSIVSLSLRGVPGGISADNRFLVYQSDASNVFSQIYILDRASNSVALISTNAQGLPGNQNSRHPKISADGRVVVFESAASDLIPNDDNHRQDLFGWNRDSGALTMISANAQGQTANIFLEDFTLSMDGSKVFFSAHGTNLLGSWPATTTQIYGRNLTNNHLFWASYLLTNRAGYSNASAISPVLSKNSRYLYYFAIPTTSSQTVKPVLYRFDLVESLPAGGFFGVTPPSPGHERIFGVSTSDDGRYFTVVATNRLYYMNADAGTVLQVDKDAGGAGFTDTASMSPDGRFVAFVSSKTNVVRGLFPTAPQLFLRDMVVRETSLLSSNVNGIMATNLGVASVTFSADSKSLLFAASEPRLVQADTNNRGDLFFHSPELKNVPSLRFFNILNFSSNRFQMSWGSFVSDPVYQLEATDSLVTPNWVAVNQGHSTPGYAFTNSPPDTAPRKFFRLRLLPISEVPPTVICSECR